jgi:predicted N-acetyltransferase YhbS
MIRAATPADADAIAEIQERALLRAHVDEPPPEPRVAAGRTLVAEIDGRVYGFITLDGEDVVALYVDPVAQGAGLGTQLRAAAAEGT